MKDFDWDDFQFQNNRGIKIAVRCKTEEIANNFLEMCDKKGMTWFNGEGLLSNNKYSCNKNICYTYDDFDEAIGYDNLDYYKQNGYTIRDWEIEELLYYKVKINEEEFLFNLVDKEIETLKKVLKNFNNVSIDKIITEKIL